jgi:hypothetical protein
MTGAYARAEQLWSYVWPVAKSTSIVDYSAAMGSLSRLLQVSLPEPPRGGVEWIAAYRHWGG